MTLKEAAEQVLGGATYDYALPQTWVDQVVKLTSHPYADVLSNFVWAYDDLASISGRPCALTEEGNEILEDVNRVMKCEYPLTPNPVWVGSAKD